MNLITRFVPLAASFLLLGLGACGGGGNADEGGSTIPPPPPAGVGPAGGTVTGPNGAKVVVPPGALTTTVDIRIEQTSAGAPALPAGRAAFGQMFAFTPHGTAFAVPVTVTLPFDPASVPAGDAAFAVAIQVDGRIVVAGRSGLTNPDFAVARYLPNGTLDGGFANAGKLTVDFFGSADIAESVAVQSDGRIVLGGLARDNVDGYGLARVNP